VNTTAVNVRRRQLLYLDSSQPKATSGDAFTQCVLASSLCFFLQNGTRCQGLSLASRRRARRSCYKRAVGALSRQPSRATLRRRPRKGAGWRGCASFICALRTAFASPRRRSRASVEHGVGAARPAAGERRARPRAASPPPRRTAPPLTGHLAFFVNLALGNQRGGRVAEGDCRRPRCRSGIAATRPANRDLPRAASPFSAAGLVWQ
jgi:hypothetical protein